MNNLNYPLSVRKNKPPSKRQMMEQKKKMRKISKIILCLLSTLEKHLQSNEYQEQFFEIRHIRTKYGYFLFQLNFDLGFLIKTMTKQTVYLNDFALKSGFRLQFLRQSAC